MERQLRVEIVVEDAAHRVQEDVLVSFEPGDSPPGDDVWYRIDVMRGAEVDAAAELDDLESLLRFYADTLLFTTDGWLRIHKARLVDMQEAHDSIAAAVRRAADRWLSRGPPPG